MIVLAIELDVKNTSKTSISSSSTSDTVNADTRITKRHDLLANERATAQHVFTLAKLGAGTLIPLRTRSHLCK